MDGTKRSRIHGSNRTHWVGGKIMALEKSFAVIGLGQFGLSIVKGLIELKQQVIAIDRDEARLKLIENDLSSVFKADCTNLKSLKDVGVANVDVAIVTFGDNLHDSIITTALLSELNIKHIAVRVDNEEYGPILKKIGAHEIIHPTDDAGRSLAFRLSATNFSQFFSFDKYYSVSTFVVPKNFKTKKLIELDWRNKFDINIVLIKKTAGNTNPKEVEKLIPAIPRAQELVEALDVLYVIGKHKDLITFSNAINK
jgi:trk system potassium uptake protein TrkA